MIAYQLGFSKEEIVLITEYEAKNYLEVAQKRNQILSWEEYEPSKDENGRILPEYLDNFDME